MAVSDGVVPCDLARRCCSPRDRKRAGLEPGAGQHLSGLTPPAKALAAVGRGARGPVVARRARPTRRRAADRRRPLLLLGARRAVATRGRARRAAASRRTRSIRTAGMAPHFDIASARARALHALATGDGRAWSSRRPRRCCRASARPSGCVTPASSLVLRTPRSTLDDLADLLVDAGFTRAGSGRRARRVLRPRRRASTSSRRARRSRSASSSSATRSSRCAATIRRRSGRSSPSIRSSSCRCATCCPMRGASGDPTTIGAIARPAAPFSTTRTTPARGCSSSSRRRVRSTAQALDAVAGEPATPTRDAAGAGGARAATRSRCPGRARAVAGGRDRDSSCSRVDASRSARPRTIACQSVSRDIRGRVDRWVAEICARRASAARRRCSWPNRPAAPSARSSCCASTTSSRCRSTRAEDARAAVGAGHDRRDHRRLPARRRRPADLVAETDVFDEERSARSRVSGGDSAGTRRRSSPISAISRSATSSSTSTTASACSSG